MSLCGKGQILEYSLEFSLDHSSYELPEVYTAAIVFWICIETKYGQQGAWFPAMLATWLATVTAVASMASGQTQFLFFQSSFVFMQLWVMYCIGTTYKQQTANQPSPDQRWLIPRMFGMYLLAVSTWLIDYHLCDYIDGVGPKSITPFNPQLHAWWHVFSAMDAYLFILTVVFQYLEQRQLKPFLYFYMGFIPAIGLETNAEAVKMKAH
ncbi:hypothetical protein DFQ27_004482 [Actinomortierella ambigua]|uniref:Alkaline ceramidase n=1 Tax=Actinomortierella ambigua TaxID=1343610 RepID=A0A9P6Q1U8_9FUNG|nr:hypothetical protein DFQ27_004482 [Actinomortierella ambigua]